MFFSLREKGRFRPDFCTIEETAAEPRFLSKSMIGAGGEDVVKSARAVSVIWRGQDSRKDRRPSTRATSLGEHQQLFFWLRLRNDKFHFMTDGPDRRTSYFILYRFEA